MDLDALKVLLEAQERTYRSTMDIVVEQFKSRMEKAEDKTADLIRSLEFSQAEVQDLKNEVKVLQKFTNENKLMIEGQQSRIIDMERRLNYQEDYSRRNNLRVTGIAEQPGGETWEQTASTVSKFLEEKLQLPALNIERAHRVGPVVLTRPRTVVVRFEKFGEREAVLRNCKKLKGTKIFINEDLCPASQDIKKQQFHLLKKAKDEGKIAYFKHTKLIIKDRQRSTPSGSSRDSDVNLGGLTGSVTGSVTVSGAMSGESTVVTEAVPAAAPSGGAGCTSGDDAPERRDREGARAPRSVGNDGNTNAAGDATQRQQKGLRDRKKK